MILKKKFILFIMTISNLLILFFIFITKKTLSNNEKTNYFDDSNSSEFIQLFGFYYKSSCFQNNFLHSVKTFPHSSNNSALKSKINSILFENKAFLIDNVNLSFFDRINFFTYGLEIKFLPFISKVF